MKTFKIFRSVLFFGILSLVPCLGSMGCTPTYQWVRPDAQPNEAEQQLAACTLSMETTEHIGEETAEARKARIDHWVDLCMRSRGWQREQVPIE